MPINAVCPECQTRFRLQDSMIGKLLRCTNCQEMFTVTDAGPGAAPPPSAADKAPPGDSQPRTRVDTPAVVSRTGNVTDFVQVIKAEVPAPPPRPVAPAPAKPKEIPWTEKGVKPPTAADFPWEEGGKPKTKPGPKEVAWSPDLLPPAPPLPPVNLDPMVDVDDIDDDGDGDRGSGRSRRPRSDSDRITAPGRPRKTGRKLILATLVAFIVVALGAGGYLVFRLVNDSPEQLMKAGKEEYEKRNWDQARRNFDKIAKEHPSHGLVPEAQFLSELCVLRQATTNMMSKADPQPGLAEWRKMMARPDVNVFGARGRFNVDLWEAGTKLEEDLLAKGNEVFNQDAPDESERWLKEATTVDADVERFRDPEVPKNDKLAAAIGELRSKIDDARVRVVKLDEVKKVLAGGTDDDIEAAKRLALKLGLDKDPSVASAVDAAERQIESKAVYVSYPEKDRKQPTAVPDDGLTSLLFAPRFDNALPRTIPGVPTVFFCQARGVLYALDEDLGRIRWAARTGLDTDIMPVRVPASDRNPEMVLVSSNTGNQFGITARGARDGRPLWHQALEMPCQGSPAIVGANAYVALADAQGTVLEISLLTGEIVGKITIGRPLGPVIVSRPGTGFLYIPGDARAVYVFAVDRYDGDGNKLEPTLLGVMNTGHPRGSLRGVPVFSNPDPNDPGPKFLVLGQADGLDTMKLRAFRLPEGADGKPTGDVEAKEIPIQGWASFPPHCDGEKIAVVTDKGQFGLYGLKLNGNDQDQNLFAFPTQAEPAGEKRPSRGQVVLAEEGVFWILAAGELRKFRFGINQGEGVRLIPYSDPIPVGEPLQNPQVNATGDTFVVVTQDGMTCRATAVDNRTGEVRWRRELGLIAKGDPLRLGESVVMMDQAGGFYRIDDTARLAQRAGAAWLVDENWLVAQPARGFAAFTGPMPGPEDSVVAVLTGESSKGPQLMVRRLVGRTLQERVFSNYPPPAGMPVVSGHMLIIALTNGNLVRVNLSTLTNPNAPLDEGPTWRGERLPATSICYLAPINDDELYTTDGARSVERWQWPAGKKAFFGKQGRVRLKERPAAAPVLLPGAPLRFVVIDAHGELTMIDGDKMTLPAERTWKPGGRTWLPAGPPMDGLRLEKAGDGSPRIAYTVDGKFVWLSPDSNAADWVGPPPYRNLAGRPVIDGKRLLLTDLAGVVRVVDMTTGLETGDEFRLSGSHAFASAAIPIGSNRVLVPLVDGTVVLGELKARPKEEPKKEKDAGANAPARPKE